MRRLLAAALAALSGPGATSWGTLVHHADLTLH